MYLQVVPFVRFRDSEGNLIAQPMGSHPSGHPHTFQSLPYDRVQQHLQEQHRLQAAAQGLPLHNKDMGQHQHHHHHHHQPSQDYDPNFYPGFSEEKPSQPGYLQELRYQPQPRQTQSLPNRYLPLKYGFIEQHEGTFNFEESKRKPHQRSRLKEMHTDSLKLQKRKQRLKLADMGVHADSAIPEVQSPTPPQTDSKPGTPEETVVTIPVVGFENPNFDYAAAENNRRYREQQKKQQLLLRQEQIRQQSGELQQSYPHLQQPCERPHVQHPQLQTAKQQQHQQQQQQQQRQQQQQQQQPAQKGKQAEVFVNNYALDYETSQVHSGAAGRQGVPIQHVIGHDGKRYFSDVNQQQQYWKQQEELMLQKENLKHQELYRKQQELLYRKQQEKLHRQQQQHKKAHEKYRRQQQEKQGQVEPQRYNNLEKQQHEEEVIRQQTERIVDPNIAFMQEYMMQQQEYARRQQQQHQHQQQDQQRTPFHLPKRLMMLLGKSTSTTTILIIQNKKRRVKRTFRLITYPENSFTKSQQRGKENSDTRTNSPRNGTNITDMLTE